MHRKFLIILLVFAFATSASTNASADFVLLNLTNSASLSAGGVNGTFNSLNNAHTGSLALNATDGSATGISVSVSGLAGGNSGGATAVAGAASAAGITQVAAERYHFTQNFGAATIGVGTYLFTGLDAGFNYTFTVFGSRNAGDTRPTEYTLTNGIVSSSETLAVSGPVNNTNVVAFAAIAPSASNGLTLSFRGLNTSGNQFGYINAVRIDAVAVPEPSSLALLAIGGIAVIWRRREKANARVASVN